MQGAVLKLRALTDTEGRTMEFLVIEVAATVAVLVGYSATVLWSDMTRRVGPTS